MLSVLPLGRVARDTVALVLQLACIEVGVAVAVISVAVAAGVLVGVGVLVATGVLVAVGDGTAEEVAVGVGTLVPLGKARMPLE